MPVFEMERRVNAGSPLVWAVVSDVEGYVALVPHLSSALVIAGTGEGMRRRCFDHRGRGWSETCTLWEEGRRYSMQVDTSDYPYPLKRMQGTWAVEDIPGGTLIKMRFEYEPKYGLVGKIMDRLVIRRAFQDLCAKLLINWEERIWQWSRVTQKPLASPSGY